MQRPSPNATPARVPTYPISSVLCLLSPRRATEAKPTARSRADWAGRSLGTGRRKWAAGGRRMWGRRRRGTGGGGAAGDFGAGRRVPIPSPPSFVSFLPFLPRLRHLSLPLFSVGFFRSAFFPADIYTRLDFNYSS